MIVIEKKGSFTLLELVVAFFIASVVIISVYRGMFFVIESIDYLEEKIEHLTKLQNFLDISEREFASIVVSPHYPFVLKRTKKGNYFLKFYTSNSYGTPGLVENIYEFKKNKLYKKVILPYAEGKFQHKYKIFSELKRVSVKVKVGDSWRKEFYSETTPPRFIKISFTWRGNKKKFLFKVWQGNGLDEI